MRWLERRCTGIAGKQGRGTLHTGQRQTRHALILPATLLVALAGCSSGDRTDAPADGGKADDEASTIPAASETGKDSFVASVPSGAMVVRVSGPAAGTYPVGTSFADGSVINLTRGDSLILFNSDGTRTLSGPGRFLVGDESANSAGEESGRGQTLNRVANSLTDGDTRTSAAASRMPQRPPDAGPNGSIDTAARYAALLFDANQRTSAAAVRRESRPPTPPPGLSELPDGPGLWTFALNSAGTHCLPALNDIVFARRGGGEALTITVTATGGASRIATIAAGRSTGGWFSDWLRAGTAYRVAVDGGPSSEARFVAIGTPPGDPAALARLLAERGCTRQVQRLARMMGAPGIARDDVAIAGRPAIVRPTDSRPVGDRPRPEGEAHDVAPPAPAGDAGTVRPRARGDNGTPVIIRPRPDPRLPDVRPPEPQTVTDPVAPADARAAARRVAPPVRDPAGASRDNRM